MLICFLFTWECLFIVNDLAPYSHKAEIMYTQNGYMDTHKGKAAVCPCFLAFLGNHPVCSVSE